MDIISVLCIVGIGGWGLIWFLYYTNESPVIWCMPIIMLLAVLGMSLNNRAEIFAKEEAAAEAAWKAASCPVYKSKCGGKSKYACERKAPAVGRIQVGDIFVNSYATC